MNNYNKINLITNNNINLLQNFIKLNNSLNFRYYDNRNIDIIKNHLLTLIITIDNKVAGYGHLDFEDNIWLGICILEKYRGIGIGTNIMKYLLDYCNNNNIEKIYLTVDKENIIAKNLYEKLGFIIEKSKSFQSFHKMVKIFKK